jgi:hypothetical protein
MNDINENKSRFVKHVFSETIINSQNYLKYPLGEDFYNLIIEDIEIYTYESSKMIDSNVNDEN